MENSLAQNYPELSPKKLTHTSPIYDIGHFGGWCRVVVVPFAVIEYKVGGEGLRERNS